jgi:hypothetical protein
MYGNRMTNHLREDGAGTAPGADDRLLAVRVQLVDFPQQLRVHKGTFFQRT